MKIAHLAGRLPSATQAAASAVTAAMAVILAAALTACGGGGSDSNSTNTGSNAAEAMSAALPVVSISASPTATTSGQIITLNWSVSNPPAAGCTASGAWSGSVASSGSQNVSAGAAGSAVYTLTCGSVSNSATVAVSTPPPSPTVTLSFAPANLTTAQSTTLSWSSANATSCSASGAWNGSKATSGSVLVTPVAAGNFTYNLSCTGDGGSADASAVLSVTAALSNSAAIVVDNGPSGVSGAINVPYVSVTVCRPGTSICQTIDHLLLDTGSYGLRLLAGQLSSTLALPAVSTASGADAGECGKFISGYTWGAVRQADVKIADEVAAGISIQVIGDSGASYTSTPSSCSSAGTNIGTLSAMGAKGILGVGMFRQDCGSACVNAAVSGIYYACASGSCSASSMPLAKQIANPVAAFAANNNGLLITLPAVGTAGLTSVNGSLIFGVNTQSNNTLGTETLYKANSGGDFSTTYKGKTYSASFIDSGSNGYFFSDSSIRQCSGGDFYCPASPLALSATNSAADGSASGTVNFNLVNLVSLPSSITAAQVGGTVGTSSSSGNYFDWGLPFFYGRHVFVVMEGSTVAGKAGPYWAY